MRNIFTQASYLLFAQGLTKVISFFYTIILARNLGVSDFGMYSVALAYYSIFSSISDFGFNRFLIREIARNHKKSKSWEIIWNVLMLRLTLVSVFFAIFSVILYLLDADKIRVSLVLLASVAVLPQAIAITFDGIFIALQKLQFSAIASFILSASTSVFGIFLISLGLGTYGAVLAVILGYVLYALVLAFLISQHFGFNLSSVTISVIKKALFGSIPYGVLGILGLLYFRIDTIILSYIRGNFETGIYSVGYKFLEGLVFIPNALTFALFPAFAKLQSHDREQIKRIFTKSSALMFLLGCFITFLYILILPIFIQIFLPKFIGAIEVIRILSLSIPFMFIYIPATAVLTSSDKYLKTVVLVSFIPLVFNIILNFIFIPQYGLIGASWVTVASDVLSAIVIILCIKKVFRYG